MQWRVLALGAALCLDVLAQSSAIFIETIAGAATFDNRQARQTPLVQPEAVWVAPNGDLFISDGNFVVRRVRNGISTIVAGGGAVIDNSLPIPGTSANFDYPNGLAGAPNGDLYISDVNHNRIQRLNSNGTIVTVVGKGTPGFSGDGGRGTFAELQSPAALALSLTGDLFIADKDNAVIRKYNIQTGIISTYAGTPGQFGYSGDGRPAVLAKLGSVQSLAVDSLGNLYLGDTQYDDAGKEAESRVRIITPAGIIDTFAGAGPVGDTGDNGPAKLAKITGIFGMAVDSAGNLYIADSTNARIRVVNRAGVISAYAGRSTPVNPGAENLPATDVYLNSPGAIALDAAGNLFIPEQTGELVRRVDARTKIITTVAGTSDPYDNRQAAEAPINHPTSVATDKFGNIYIADGGHYRIRKIDAKTKLISTIAGDGKWAQAVDATANSLGGTLAISVDPQNRLLIADRYESLVRVVDLNTGVMKTLIDLKEYDSEPTGVAADELGYVYISDWWADQVYELAPNGDLTIVAGVEYDPNAVDRYTGDGGLGWKATINGPQGLAIDTKGRLLICDTQNHVVRVLDLSTYIINTFAGDGYDNSDYDTYPAVQASMRSPFAVAADTYGWVYIADSVADQVRIVTDEGIMYTAGGGNGRGFAGDNGLAILAQFHKPRGVAVSDTDILVADSFNYKIRRLYWVDVQNNLVVDPPKLTFRATAGGATPSIQLLTVSTSYLGLPVDYTVDDSEGSWLYACTATEDTDCAHGSTPDLVGIEARPRGLSPGRYTANLVISTERAPDVKIPVEFIIDPPNVVTSATLSPSVLRFTVPQNSSSVQRLEVTSAGQELDWRIRRQTESAWLKFSATSGKTPTTVEVTVDSSTLRPGTYYSISYLDIANGSTTLLIATITVTDAKATLQLDRDSMLFEAIEGTTAAQPQPVHIYNTGAAPLSWQITIPALDDQRRPVNWIRSSLSQNTIQSGAAPSRVNISVDPAGLRAGVYSVPVVITAPGAAGAPQVLGVRMRILPANTKARAVFDKTGLVFVGTPGGTIREQAIQLSSTGGALSFSTSIRTESRVPWLAVSPSSGSVLSSSQISSLRFQITNTSLSAGVHEGTVNFSFSDGTVREVTVVMILSAGAASGVSSAKDRSAGCEPKQQVMVVPTLSDNFSLSVGWPIPIQVQVFDDCGTPSATSSVNVVFDNGDPALALKNLSGGNFAGTWTPQGSASASVSLTMSALRPGMKNALWQSRGRITREASTPPILSSGGVLNAASRISTSLLAPGGRMILQGANLPESPADALVLVGGSEAKVISSSPVEMQIVAPPQLDGLSQTYIIVKAREFSTSPQTVSVAPVDPGLYPLPEGTAASPGGTLTVTATGLGAVDATGNVTLRPTAKLGNLDATVTGATLPAGADGIYQLRITIPAGASGAQELTILQNGVSSNAIPVNVR